MVNSVYSFPGLLSGVSFGSLYFPKQNIYFIHVLTLIFKDLIRLFRILLISTISVVISLLSLIKLINRLFYSCNTFYLEKEQKALFIDSNF